MAYELTPGKAPVLVSGDVHFWLTIDGRVQHYVVSHEALEDHFGDTHGAAGDGIAAFNRGREAICRVAADKLGSASVMDSGEFIVVGTFDL
jgi:hypothetical protein